ncbi:MAG: Rne/Rng family ribonuclease [Gammaproteobacteria bacterium]|nr:Rne/Rng family ribonuclease [Gammaproteobacteria bacterium]
MSEEILINVTPQETRVALVENGVLQEIYIERNRNRGLVGNIYKGKVCRVLPGMQAAFVDIGMDKAAFLHVADVIPQTATPNASAAAILDPEEVERAAKGELPEPESNGSRNGNANGLTISDLLRESQEVLVQVVKDPLGTKGARLTTHVSIPSRYAVYLPSAPAGTGISTKIDDDTERARLKEILAAEVTGDTPGDPAMGGVIARTAAEGATEDSLSSDVRFLKRLWESIGEQSKTVKAPTIVHEDLALALRTLRDLVGPEVEKIRVDSRSTYQRAIEFAERFIPDIAERIELYKGERPLFEMYGVEDEIQRALERKVQLKSGGYLIIDQTEAMTTIDVNTGGYVGRRTLEETIFKTNLEAAQAIARQLRLRNLGGIIIIDFIDMQEDEHKRQVLRALEKSLENDHAKSNICEVSALGLVEMTRKRTRESLEHVLCEPCPTCQGRGQLKTPETICYEVFREILREARQYDADKLLVIASQDVVDRMQEEESASVAELEAFIGKPIRFQAETHYTQEQFDVVLM